MRRSYTRSASLGSGGIQEITKPIIHFGSPVQENQEEPDADS